MKAIQPFFTFQNGKSQAAIDFYIETFPESEVISIQKYPVGEPNEGTIMKAEFSIGDQTFRCSDSPIEHDFDFTPSTSFLITCESDKEIRDLAKALVDGGEDLMPIDDYGFGQLFTWMQDRFGISWQLIWE